MLVLWAKLKVNGGVVELLGWDSLAVQLMVVWMRMGVSGLWSLLFLSMCAVERLVYFYFSLLPAFVGRRVASGVLPVFP